MARKKTSNRQKYNFLAGWCSQLDEAFDEEDELADEVRNLLGLDIVERTFDELCKRVAECESALAELDADGSEGTGEESESHYDGDDDSELEGVEPQMGGPRPADGRLAAPVGRTSERQVAGRRMKVPRPQHG